MKSSGAFALPTPRSQQEIVDEAWESRTGDPACAVALGEGLLTATDARIRALAGAAVGYGQLHLGEGGEAAQTLEHAGADAALAADDLAIGRVHLGLGAVRLAEGAYAAAATAFREAQQAFARAGERSEEAGARVNLGLVHRNLGDLPRALELLLEGAEAFADRGDGYGEAVALLNIAQVHRDLGDPAEALSRLTRARMLARDLERPAFAIVVRTAYGSALGAAGERVAGEAELRSAVARARVLGAPPILAEALGSLATVVGQRDRAKGRALLDEALALVQEAGRSWTLATAWMARGDLSDDLRERRDAYERAATLADERAEQVLSHRAHRAAAEACEDDGDAAAALSHWRRSAAAADQLAADRQAQRLARVEVSLAVQALRAQQRDQDAHIAELVAAGRARSDLVAMLAHELRNPLSGAQLLAAFLRDEVPDELAATVDQLMAVNDRMARILDATSADAAAERGELVLQRQPTDLLRLVEAIVAEQLPAAARKEQRVILEGGSVRVAVDAGRLFHSIANLLSNAIKYSPPGAAIRVVVSVAGPRARVAVDDEGPGIDDGAADALFEPFARGGASPTAGERSTGLGLHIARRMVELHGGRIGARSRPGGGGATFWFEVPRNDVGPRAVRRR